MSFSCLFGHFCVFRYALASGIRDYTDPTPTANGKAISQNANWALATGGRPLNAREQAMMNALDQVARPIGTETTLYRADHDDFLHRLGVGNVQRMSNAQLRQALVAKLRADPTALLRMTDSETLTAFQEIENRPIGQGENDTFVQRYMDAIGWSEEKPVILRPGAYSQARQAAGAVNLYHADHDGWTQNNQRIMAADCNRQYFTGNRAYSSNGIYGAGTYWAAQSASKSARFGDHQFKGFLNSKAKVVTINQMDTLEQNFKKSHPQAYKYLFHNRKSGYGGPTETTVPIIAAANGYNTILAHGDLAKGHYVITLNRGATTVCSQINPNASYGMKNW